MESKKLLKFGGSSVASPEAVRQVTSIIEDSAKKASPCIVVVSAIQGSTDALLSLSNLAASGHHSYLETLSQIESRHTEMAKALTGNASHDLLSKLEQLFEDLREILQGIKLVREVSKKTLDQVMSFGERLSALILSQALCEGGRKAELVDARKLVRTNAHFGNASVDFEYTYAAIKNYFSGKTGIFVVTGFIGSTETGETTTLGRGGSDYSAALFGAALDVNVVEIWTDVSGVMTSDPRVVKKALPIETLTYREAMELCHFGAKVIYPPSLQPALDKQITVHVKNTFDREAPGTRIGAAKEPGEYAITGISSISEIALLRLEGSGMVGVAGTSKRLFGALAEEGVNVILISQASSEHSICFAITPEEAGRAKKAIEKEFQLEIRGNLIDELTIESDLSIVAIVGENMCQRPGIAGKIFQALGKNGVNVVTIAQGSSELNISIVVSKQDQAKTLNLLHDAFFLSELKTVNLFLVGPGLVGKALLRQLAEHAESLQREQNLEIRLTGIAKSTKMVFDREGLPLSKWSESLEASSQASSPELFYENIQAFNLPNSIFVDCTASEEVAKIYEAVLKNSISIITPNKRANSGTYERYLNLQEIANRANVKFYYETNVGAGLPVLSTLCDLRSSGDEIIKIEAVLSGTLSFLFNSFREGTTFSEIVQLAKEKGFTEPDPREDLNGMDVARKLLILARGIGLPLEEKDIQVENLIPESCRKAKDVSAFLKQLATEDGAFEAKRHAAGEQGRKLCYIGCVQGDSAHVRLEAVPPEHPFSSLSGSDNMISFTTKRYFERPLVIKGPGAGTDVTAAGIFADIVRASSYLS